MTAPAGLYSIAENTLPPLQLIDQSRRRVAGTEAGRVAGLLAVSDKEVAQLLNQSVATFHRQANVGRLDPVTSERLLIPGQLARYGASVFQNRGKFTRELRRPLQLVENRSPLDSMDSSTGIQLVEEILGCIEYGVFS